LSCLCRAVECVWGQEQGILVIKEGEGTLLGYERGDAGRGLGVLLPAGLGTHGVHGVVVDALHGEWLSETRRAVAALGAVSRHLPGGAKWTRGGVGVDPHIGSPEHRGGDL
jgi:hypothetical protein